MKYVRGSICWRSIECKRWYVYLPALPAHHYIESIQTCISCQGRLGSSTYLCVARLVHSDSLVAMTMLTRTPSRSVLRTIFAHLWFIALVNPNPVMYRGCCDCTVWWANALITLWWRKNEDGSGIHGRGGGRGSVRYSFQVRLFFGLVTLLFTLLKIGFASGTDSTLCLMQQTLRYRGGGFVALSSQDVRRVLQ